MTGTGTYIGKNVCVVRLFIVERREIMTIQLWDVCDWQLKIEPLCVRDHRLERQGQCLYPISSIKLKTHYHTSLCLATPFLHSLCSSLPFTIRLLKPSLPIPSLSLCSPHGTSSLLPSFIEMQAQRMPEEGYLMCVFVLAFRVSVDLSTLPWPGFFLSDTSC